MTALLLASHQLKPAASPPRFGVRDLVRAGRGIVSVQDIKNAASKMLARVSLQARPAPTSLIYPMIMPLSSSGVAKNELHSLLDCATFLTELSVCDSYFVTVPSAVTAFAAVKCAVEACPSVSGEAKRALYDFIEESTKLNVHSQEVQAAELRLGSFCLAEGEDLDDVHAAVVEAEVASSPRGVDVVPCDESEIKPLPTPSESEGPQQQQQRMKRMVSDEDIVVRPKRPSNDDGTATMTRVKRIRHFVVIED
uniref:Cyclin C-terminal domain-containing protein n=1 Tax=Pseudictyota dubia TaxID=2749911 RepID=A0A7R9VWB3_9STRA